MQCSELMSGMWNKLFPLIHSFYSQWLYLQCFFVFFVMLALSCLSSLHCNGLPCPDLFHLLLVNLLLILYKSLWVPSCWFLVCVRVCACGLLCKSSFLSFCLFFPAWGSLSFFFFCTFFGLGLHLVSHFLTLSSDITKTRHIGLITLRRKANKHICVKRSF